MFSADKPVMPAQPHIAILGAGPGGYVAAIRAAVLVIQFIQVHGKLDNYVDYLQDMDNALKRLSLAPCSVPWRWSIRIPW